MTEEVTGVKPDEKQNAASAAASTDKKSSGARVERPFPAAALRKRCESRNPARVNADSPQCHSANTGLPPPAVHAIRPSLCRSPSDGGFLGALTDLGTRAAYPPSSADADSTLLEAFNLVDVFRKVVEHYGGNNLPERHFLDNTLQTTYGLHPDALDEFVDLFEKNCRTAKIGKDLPSAPPAGRAGNGHVTPTVVSGVPTKANKAGRPVAFIIMPFTEKHDIHEVGFFAEVMAQLFNPALERCRI